MNGEWEDQDLFCIKAWAFIPHKDLVILAEQQINAWAVVWSTEFTNLCLSLLLFTAASVFLLLWSFHQGGSGEKGSLKWTACCIGVCANWRKSSLSQRPEVPDGPMNFQSSETPLQCFICISLALSLKFTLFQSFTKSTVKLLWKKSHSFDTWIT